MLAIDIQAVFAPKHKNDCLWWKVGYFNIEVYWNWLSFGASLKRPFDELLQFLFSSLPHWLHCGNCSSLSPAFTLKIPDRKLPVAGFTLEDVRDVKDGKQEPTVGGNNVCMMRPLLLRSSLGRLVTGFGSLSSSSCNKVVTQAAAAPHLCYLRKTMHYQTEPRGHPNSPDYRLYFSKFTAAIMRVTVCVWWY